VVAECSSCDIRFENRRSIYQYRDEGGGQNGWRFTIPATVATVSATDVALLIANLASFIYVNTVDAGGQDYTIHVQKTRNGATKTLGGKVMFLAVDQALL